MRASLGIRVRRCLLFLLCFSYGFVFLEIVMFSSTTVYKFWRVFYILNFPAFGNNNIANFEIQFSIFNYLFK